MQAYDILMLGVLALATIRGYIKGLAWQISSIASILVSYIVAYRFRGRLAAHIEMPDPWRNLVAMLVLFVGTSLVIWFLFRNVKGAIEKANLRDFDQQLGAIFGAVKGAAWCTVITLFAVSLLQPDMSQQVVESRSRGYIARILASSKTIIPSQVQEVIQPYIQRAEIRLQDRRVVEQSGRPEASSESSQDWFGGENRRDDPLREFSNPGPGWQ